MNNEGQIPTIGDNTTLLESMHHDDLIGDQGDDFANLEDYDSEGDISITIGEVTQTPFDKRIPPRPTETVDNKMDQSEPYFKNMLIYDLDPVSIDDRPWNKPGADITDYFNYGFVEETWNVYRERQRRIRQESSKIQRDGLLTQPQLSDVGGIMVLNSDSTLIPDSSMMPLMNPPSMMGPPGSSSLDFHRLQTPFFPGGPQLHPNYFMGARFGMRPLAPQFQPQMMPGDRNPRFQPPPVVSPVPVETKHEDSPGKSTPRRHKEKGRRRRSMSESSREERKRKRGVSREKTKHVSRGRRHEAESKTKDRR